MKVAIFIYNRIQMYSGGQYHAFALGKAVALRGNLVDFYWNHPPIFADEFAHIGTRSFAIQAMSLRSPERYDYIVIAPSGFYVPSYYETALQVAAASMARVCVLNYESANWFNRLAPTPDDPRVWDYWRRVVSYGGLVISSTQEADPYAKSFYTSPIAEIFFGVSSPPINSDEASRIRAQKFLKDGGVVVFVRCAHDYKGGRDLLKLSPKVLSGHSLHIIFGGEQDDEFLKELKAHYGSHDVTIRVHSHISVAEKYILLAKAQVLLFLSYFEGFGYPPLEAFAVGTEVVCYDLPVLRETLAHLAFFAPRGQIQELEDCLSLALSTTRDTSVLVEQADLICGFTRVGARFESILEMHLSVISPLHTYIPYLSWGPFDKDQAIAIPATCIQIPYPPFVERSTLSGNGLVIDIRLATHQPIVRVDIEGDCVEHQHLIALRSDHDPNALHYLLRLLGKKIGSGLLHFRLRDTSTYTEIVRIVKLEDDYDR